jgi:hypothetical protein
MDIVFEVIYPEEYDFKYGFLWAFLLAALIGVAKGVKSHYDVMKKLDGAFEENQRAWERLNEEMQKNIQRRNQRVFVQTKEDDLFGITSPEAVDKKSLKAKYRELSRKYHPDLGGSEDDMKKINAIYENLKRKYNVGL